MGVSLARRAVEPRVSAMPIAAAELAWLAAPPCALLTLLAVALLGPPLGHALFMPSHGEALWPPGTIYTVGRAEPVKHARFLLALLGAVTPAGIVLLIRRTPRLPSATTRTLVLASQLLLCCGLIAATLAQRHVAYPLENTPSRWQIFTTRTLVVALLVAGTVLAALRRSALHRRIRDALSRRWVDAVCIGIAALGTAAWLLPSIGTEHTAANGPFPDLPEWAMGDAYAILDGRTPLVNFHAVYSELWSYVAAIPMALFGATIDVFTITMVTISGVALLAIYAVLRRVVRDAAIALLLYLPFLATALFQVAATEKVPWRATNASIYSMWPMRYAAPCLLVWLTARHLDGDRPRSAWPIALLAGLTLINNFELGLAAFLATTVALACRPAPRPKRALAQITATMAGGVLGAAALVSALTLVRAGSLPHFGLLREFPHVFGMLGLVSMPMPTVGFHLVLYATFTAALATAAVRLVQREPDRLLTSLLAWSGVFGLMAGSYYAGRSDPFKLAALFPAWAFALLLLLVVVARRLIARAWRLPSPSELATVVGFGLMVCSLTQLSPPWREVARLHHGGMPAVFERPFARAFVGAHASPGESVTLVMPFGHRIAYDLGLVNVSPYGTIEELVTRRQWVTTLEVTRAAHVHKLFVSDMYLVPAQIAVLRQSGFVERAHVREAQEADSFWTDTTAAR